MIQNLINDHSIQGWIFDLDGVITDTAIFHYQAWKQMADEEGYAFNENINEQLRGVSRRASLDVILNGKAETEEKILEMMERKNNFYKKLLDNLTKDDILPGITDLLDKLKAAGRKTAIASASRNTEFILNHLGLNDYFDGVASGGFVVRPKPAPDIFVHAAGQIGLAIENCIVLEDAEAGVKGAAEAGFLTIGVGPETRVGMADFRVDSTGDL